MWLKLKLSPIPAIVTVAIFNILLSVEIGHSLASKLQIIGQEDSVGECPSETESKQTLKIGSIQGSSYSSPCVGRQVVFMGVVIGSREDQNTEGARFYTIFVQDPPGNEDMNPETSDGIAVFLGANPSSTKMGDLVKVTGTVQEYYGLTEIGYRDLVIDTIDQAAALPAPKEISPPLDNELSFEYFEKLEGMLVSLDFGFVVGPTFRGCGLAVVERSRGSNHIIAVSDMTATGHIINVLHSTDVSCAGFPTVSVGDGLNGIIGPLSFEFDQFKVIHQPDWPLLVEENSLKHDPLPLVDQGQFTTASFNVNDYFEIRETGVESSGFDGVISENKRGKITNTIHQVLNCPTIIGLQEVENLEILDDLAQSLNGYCGFSYESILIKGPDIRGINNALMVDPRQVIIEDARLRQHCSQQITEVIDLDANCPAGEWPLFSRPPLEVMIIIGDEEYILYNNHFKSKRGGVTETAPIRRAQAFFIAGLADEAAELFPSREIIVMGDFNDFEESPAAQELVRSGRLINILERIPADLRYTYNFGGVSQLVDWILVSRGMIDRSIDVSIAHVNADYPYSYAVIDEGDRAVLRSSDHDIPVASFWLTKPPKVEPTQVLTFPTTTPVPTVSPSPPFAVTSTDIPIQEPLLQPETSDRNVQVSVLVLVILPIVLIAGGLAIILVVRGSQKSN